MKHKNLILFSLAFTGLVFTVASCKKDSTQKEVAMESYNFSNKAMIQVVNATVGTSRNYIHVDGAPVNGAALSYGSVFPSTSTPAYFSIDGGLHSITIRDTSSTSTQPAMTVAEIINSGVSYTLFTFDTLTTIKNKLVSNSIVIPSDTTCRIRIANFVYNPNGTPAVDVFSYRLNINVFTNVNVTDVTSFITYPSRISVDTLYFRPTGTTTNLFKLSIGGLTPKRSYTAIFRGSDRVTNSKTASLFANY